MHQAAPVFIIGTGRCGSTLLSNLLNQHADILSLSEFFMSVTDLCTLTRWAFPNQPIDGAQFWQIIARVNPKQDKLLKHGLEMDEMIYPHQDKAARFNQVSGIPAIAQTTLPLLCQGLPVEDTDALFDELQAVVPSFPLQPIAQHYTALFEYLRQRFAKRHWVERSGSSIRILPQLFAHFPQAKFVHIVRDGRNCAISMEKHHGFRMGLISIQLTEILDYDPYEATIRSGLGDLPDDIAAFMPECFDADAFLAYRQSPSLYGIYWSGEILEAVEQLDKIPTAQLLTLQYEAILRDPQTQLTRLMQFIDPSLDNTTWLLNAAAQIRAPSSQWQALSPTEQARLNETCASGFAALHEFELDWD